MCSDETSAHALLQKVLGYSQADQTEVVYLGTESALTRFANNSIHQNVAESNHELRVRAVAEQGVEVPWLGVAIGKIEAPEEPFLGTRAEAGVNVKVATAHVRNLGPALNALFGDPVAIRRRGPVFGQPIR